MTKRKNPKDRGPKIAYIGRAIKAPYRIGDFLIEK